MTVDNINLNDESGDNVPELSLGEVEAPVSAKDAPEVPSAKVEEKEHQSNIDGAPNSFLEMAITHPQDKRSDGSIDLPSNIDVRASKSIDMSDGVKQYGSPNAVGWANTLSEGVKFNTQNEIFMDSLNDPEKEFLQVNRHNNMELTSATPRQRIIPGQQTTGEAAVMRMMARMSLGVPRQVPLWHSGMWLTFKPPVETEILDLARLISADKIILGRQSYALMYSNISAITMSRVMDFALDHILTLTVGNDQIPTNKLREYISCLDAPAIIVGMAQTMFPRGFPYSRACIENPGKCTHVEHGILNIFKMQHSSLKSLTDWQRNHMSGRQPKIKKLDEVLRYQSELKDSQKRRVVLNEGASDEIAFVLRIPSMAEYIDSGYTWVDNIVENIEKAMAEDPSIVNRNDSIMRSGRATAMRQYTHWVESIEEKLIGADGEVIVEVISDRATIEKELDVMSSDDKIRVFFMEKVIEFINKATIDVIGIPVYSCKVCGAKQKDEEEKFPQHKEIIPLDALQLFFALMSKKMDRIDQRPLT